MCLAFYKNIIWVMGACFPSIHHSKSFQGPEVSVAMSMPSQILRVHHAIIAECRNVHNMALGCLNCHRTLTSFNKDQSKDSEVKKKRKAKYTHKHMHTYTCIHTYTHIQTYIRTHINTYINTHNTYIHTYIRTYVRTYVRTHTHTHTHTYTHTHTSRVIWKAY